MQINCIKCGSKSIITSRKEVDPKLVQLYCACKNVEHCGHTFVMDLAFSHTISPSAMDRRSLLLDLLQAMPDSERRELLRLADQHN
ncbi:ogr/Delta-like zinc finger family protein [Microbulbifer thermotolerans]|uniref:ogr/Delta-like zinc finger family protein n=1 Tax=Microbulbifer thermotolerans TaxID=252514 RepID=UPI00224AC784|nr:ogr/Delta-like zinc finger family protein [Microbulbifer thermotolerans]MCX2834471.1 ogr/Delta-like zinc finger family protein [Microbulbifer thermotolerans]